MKRTCRDEILAALPALPAIFTADDVVLELKGRGTTFKESTIRTHVASRMCGDAPPNHAVTYKDLRRVEQGRYTRA